MSRSVQDESEKGSAYSDIPGPTGVDCYQVLYRILTCGDRPTEALDPSVFTRLQDRYGPVVRIPVPVRPDYVVLTEPHLVKAVLEADSDRFEKHPQQVQELHHVFGQGLVTLQGSEWQHHRAQLMPLLSPNNIEAFTDRIRTNTELAFEQTIQADSPSALSNVSVHVLTRILGDVLFGSDYGKISDELNAGLTLIGEAFPREASAVPTPSWLPLPHQRKLREADTKLNSALQRAIELAQRTESDQPTVLNQLLSTSELEGEQIRDELRTLMIAGMVTRTALSWTLLLIARHPEIQQSLYATFDSQDASGVAPTGDSNSLLRRVIQESLRLCPPLPPAARTPKQVTEVGGYRIPPGARIVVNQVSIHRAPAYWDAPFEFRPSRFTEGWREAKPDYAYYPFGGGRRACVARRFAYHILEIVVRSCVSRYELVDAGNEPPSQSNPAHPPTLHVSFDQR